MPIKRIKCTQFLYFFVSDKLAAKVITPIDFIVWLKNINMYFFEIFGKYIFKIED